MGDDQMQTLDKNKPKLDGKSGFRTPDPADRRPSDARSDGRAAAGSSTHPAAETPLRICPIGIDERQRNALHMLFEGAGRRGYRFAEDQQAEAWIVDLDHLGALDALQAACRETPGRPALFMSLNDPGEIVVDGNTVSAIYLRKPFRVEDFVAQLPRLADAARLARPLPPKAPDIDVPVSAFRIAEVKQSSRAARLLSEEVAQSLVGTNPDVDLADTTQLHLLYYDPTQFLHHRIDAAWQRAKAAGRPLRVDGPWPTFTLFPMQNRVELSAPIRDYHAIAALPNPHGEQRETLLDAELACPDHHLAYPSFLWKTTLWAARGRLPKGTPLHTPVFLRWWPNFTRLALTPSALAIAALWSREPHTLATTARVLRIPQRWLFSFYSAASALDLAGVSRRSVDQMFTPQPPPKARPEAFRGLLGRMVDKLRSALDR